MCRYCGGRLLSRPVGENGTEYVCAQCEAKMTGADVRVLCACGVKVHGKSPFACQTNAAGSVGQPKFLFGIKNG